jgi:TolB-like protein/tetratricopeptide (TPR) repeat protein/tRNA A-37 threonylcarbamoyl transferase component Bud32
MNLHGLSHSVTTLVGQAPACPRCHGTSTVANGLCLACMLETGINQDGIDNGAELAATLDSIAVSDTHWRLGNYEILEEIGRGGMGVIYRARQRHSRRIVAVKRLLGYHADSRETLARFRREAEAAASLDHPNILPIYEVNESEEGVPFFSMKYAAGGSLQEVGPTLRDNPREIIRLMAKVTRAIQHAHRQGILHRDLKPGNILLDARGEPLVTDFGLAKWLETNTELTRTLTVYGTPGYIAPEQARGRAADLKPTADVYSLGAILFELLAGRPPFLGEHALAVIQQAAEKPAPNLRSLVKSADRDLETICARCLEREPASRYRSAGDLAEDFERWLEGRPIIARPVSLPTRAWRWSRRNPVLAAGLASILVLVGMVVVRQFQTRRLAASVRESQLAFHSVVVLPFLDLDRLEPNNMFTQALAESLQKNLSQFGPIRINFASKGHRYWADTANADDIKEANQSIGARSVLTGSVRIIRGKTRVSIRLINAATGENLVSRSFEALPADLYRGESIRSLAGTIFSVLDAKDWSGITTAGRDSGLRNPLAREFIISGRQLMFRDTTQDLDRSIACLEKALELEPRSALAHAYLAASTGGRVHVGWDDKLLARAESEAKQAVALEPELRDAHRILAGVFWQKSQFPQALEEQLRAVEMGGPEELLAALLGQTYEKLGQPVRALGWLALARRWASRPGDYDALIGDCWTELADDKRAEAAYQRSMDLRPESPEGWVGLCHLRLLQGNASAARQLCQENRERALRDKPSATTPDAIAAQIELFSGNYAEAEQLYRALAARDRSNGVAFYGSVSLDSAIGRSQQLTGKNAAGVATLEQARVATLNASSASSPAAVSYRLASIESSLGNTTASLQHFEAAIKAGWIDARSPLIDPRFDTIASDGRFKQMISDLTTKVNKLRQEAIRRSIDSAATGEKDFARKE